MGRRVELMNEPACVPMRDFLVQMIQDADERLRDHIVTQIANTQEALASAERLEKERFEAAQRRTDLRYEAAKEATEKAEHSLEKRFESVNEFRKTLADQAATFLPRAESETRIQSLLAKIHAVETRLDQRFEIVNEFRKTLSDQAAAFIPRKESDERIAGVMTMINALEGRLDRKEALLDKKEGQGMGLNAGWNFLISGIGLISTLVAIFIMLSRH